MYAKYQFYKIEIPTKAFIIVNFNNFSIKDNASGETNVLIDVSPFLERVHSK